MEICIGLRSHPFCKKVKIVRERGDIWTDLAEKTAGFLNLSLCQSCPVRLVDLLKHSAS